MGLPFTNHGADAVPQPGGGHPSLIQGGAGCLRHQRFRCYRCFGWVFQRVHPFRDSKPVKDLFAAFPAPYGGLRGDRGGAGMGGTGKFLARHSVKKGGFAAASRPEKPHDSVLG